MEPPSPAHAPGELSPPPRGAGGGCHPHTGVRGAGTARCPVRLSRRAGAARAPPSAAAASRAAPPPSEIRSEVLRLLSKGSWLPARGAFLPSVLFSPSCFVLWVVFFSSSSFLNCHFKPPFFRPGTASPRTHPAYPPSAPQPDNAGPGGEEGAAARPPYATAPRAAAAPPQYL